MENLRGIGFMILAMASFALEDALVKTLAASMPAGLVLIFVGLCGAVFFWLLCRRRGIRVVSPAFLNRPLLLRTIAEIAGTVFMVAAIVSMPLSTASAIMQAAPLMVGFGAVLLFGAVFGWRRWAALATGFAGVLVIIRPGLDSFDPVSLLALAATASMSARDLATRAVPREIPSLLIAFYGFCAMAVAGGILTPFLEGAAPVASRNLWLLLMAACCGICGYFAITQAMRIGEVAVVTPFRYTRLLFAITLGFVVFGERPDLPMMVGAALILGSGLYTLHRERHARSRPLSSALKAG
ncbi:DMT family transporter [Mangrovicoccus algicola]|uniref:DMT family transporter n=1 Tax=Mangrovicoccus algicola TaxID=2771008 RepID=A0A8J7CKC7_9RHOB|nr:DMT family transporter [Mangrovicoccus algicola]MBE3638626.1 DMT family transporter [Mangrovicoccus algicola]